MAVAVTTIVAAGLVGAFVAFALAARREGRVPVDHTGTALGLVCGAVAVGFAVAALLR